MTVGIAAIANRESLEGRTTGREAIVMMSDKQYEYSDGLIAVTEIRKQRGLLQKTGPGRAGWFALYASNDTSQVHRLIDVFCEVHAPDLEGQIDRGDVPHARTIYTSVEAACRIARDEWSAGQAGLPDSERTRFGPELLLCGYSKADELPCIYSIDGETCLAATEHETGYASVGIASPAVLRHLESRHVRATSKIHEVIYACYEAKQIADGYTGISRDFYAWVLVRGCEQPVPIEQAVIDRCAAIFKAIQTSAIPFRQFDLEKLGRIDWDGLERDVARWFNEGRPECPNATSSSTSPEQPSSRSQSGGQR